MPNLMVSINLLTEVTVDLVFSDQHVDSVTLTTYHRKTFVESVRQNETLYLKIKRNRVESNM